MTSSFKFWDELTEYLEGYGVENARELAEKMITIDKVVESPGLYQHFSKAHFEEQLKRERAEDRVKFLEHEVERLRERDNSPLTLQVPAGTYWLGDPCYCIDSQSQHDEWSYMLDTAGLNRLERDWRHITGHYPSGTKVYSFSTQFGDGTYRGSNGHYYGVDAGLIGLTEFGGPEIVDQPFESTIVEFGEETVIARHHDGVLVFGDVVIDTGWTLFPDQGSL